GQRGLQRGVGVGRSPDQTRTGRSQPVRVKDLSGSLDHRGVDTQPEIVVAGHVDDEVGGRTRPQLTGEPGLGPACGQALQRIQPARQGTPNAHETGKLSPTTDSFYGCEGL